MKVLVCGSRTYGNRPPHSEPLCIQQIERMHYELSRIHDREPITLLIEGEAPGADSHARAWAEDHGIPVSAHPADWKKHGKAAGPIRNREMLEAGPDLVVAFVDKPLFASKGTQNMIKQAIKAHIQVGIHEVWVKR